jgi:beta-phosphoglucomutase-like phosphatase (HAD superfamily)
MTLSHALFDLDGVVFDTEYAVSEITANLATAAGYPISAAVVFAKYAGLSSKDKFESIACESKQLVPGDVLAGLVSGHRTGKSGLYTNPDLSMIPYIQEVFQATQEKAIKISIGSSNTSVDSINALKTAQIYHLFADNVYGSDMVGGRKKPDPAIYDYAILTQGIDPSKLMIVEDSEAGITAAVAAAKEAFVCGYLDPRLGEGEIAKQKWSLMHEAGANIIVRDMRHLALVIEQLSY